MGNKSTRAVTPTEKALQQLLTRPSALRPAMFELTSSGHHGVPSNAKTIAFCGLQGILAIGTASGHVKLYGKDGLEVMLEAPRSKTNLTIGVVHMKFTAQQRLVVTYSNSSIRLYNLANTVKPEVETPETWTLSTITCIETITYLNFPYIFVALDDGNVHVFHEETGRTSTYVITPRDCGITTAEDDKHMQFVSAMAVNPRDASQLLIAYEVSTTIFLWDFTKRKVAKDFSLAKTKGSASQVPQEEPNSAQSISWHSSGKRFVAGFKYGGFGVFRIDKPHGLYHLLPGSGDGVRTPISRLQWICAPPTSRHSHLPGAVIFNGGRGVDDKERVLTIVYPPREMSEEDATTAFVKSEHLTWLTTTIQAHNRSEIEAFAVAMDQIDYSTRLAPFSIVMLSGNPLDGHQPAISVQCLPCFVRLREEDKEDWEWVPDRRPKVTSLPPPLLQQSPIKSSLIVSLGGCDGSLQASLLAAMDTAIDPVGQLMMLEDFDWPINGGSVVEPMLKGFVPPSAQGGDMQYVFQSATLLLTGHANGFVLFWEVFAPAERASRGTLKLLHVVDVAGQLTPEPASREISCVAFCRESRTLVVGFSAGEVAMLEFGLRSEIVKPEAPKPNEAETELATPQDESSEKNEEEKVASVEDQVDSIGYHVAFSLHIHSSEIKKICFSTTYNYAAVADDAGVVSLIELATHDYELLIFDISSEEAVSVDSLLLSELVQVTEIPVPVALTNPSTSPNGSKTGTRSPPRLPFDRRANNTPTPDQMTVIQHKEIVPILFVGRGNGKMEMFHVQTAKKIGESFFDQHKTSSLSSIIMVGTNGKRVEIRGKPWTSPQIQASVVPVAQVSQDGAVDPESVAVELDSPPAKTKFSVSPEAVQMTELAIVDAVSKAADTHIEQIRAESDDGECIDLSNVPTKWPQTNIIETRVPAGSLGLHLYTEIQDHAIVKGFVLENEKARALAEEGVSPGHVIVSINGVDLLPYSRGIICSVLEKLRDHEKVMVFAQGFGPLPDSGADPEVGSLKEVLTEKPRFLVCTCGKSIHLVQAALPKASEIASGLKEQLPAHPLASVEVSAQVELTAIIRVPVQERVENCVVVIDQSNRVYVLSLMTLTMIWSGDCPQLGSALDGIHCSVSANGELIIANTFGEIERFCLFAEATQRENAIFERLGVKTRVFLEERAYPFDKEQHPSPKKKSGIAALKKLVTGSKEIGDLNKVFQFSAEEEDRRKLMGDRKSVASPKADAAEGETDEKAAVKKTTQGLNTTKDVLNQATQHLQERGEKLGDLAVKTEQMKDTAEDFYKTMKAFNDKNANKKWYEF